MVAILNKMRGRKNLKKAGFETYGTKEKSNNKPTIKGDINKGLDAIKKYAAGADDRRKAKIQKGKTQLALEKQKTALLKEKQKQQKLRNNDSMGGFSIGADSAPSGKKKKKPPQFSIGI